MNSTTLQRPPIGGAATDALVQNPLPALRDLSIAETDAEVIITGFVNTYYLKQLAQEAVRPVLGGRRLLNRVKVLRSIP